MTALDDALALVAPRLAFVDEERVSWDGRVTRSRLPAPDGYPPSVALAAQLLYQKAYAQPDEGRGPGYAYVPDALLQEELAQALADRAGGPLDATPGWLHARGARDHADARGTTRVYWNVCVAGAAPLLASLRALDGAGVAWHAKVVDDPQQFRRADAAVLYLPTASWPAAAPVLARVRADVARWLKRATPLLALPLAPGLAVAEAPGSRESFGEHRCRLLAEGLWEKDAPARFRREGIDPAAPHLAPGSRARYEVPT